MDGLPDLGASRWWPLSLAFLRVLEMVDLEQPTRLAICERDSPAADLAQMRDLIAGLVLRLPIILGILGGVLVEI